METTQVDLYDAAQQVVTNATHSTATVSGNKIGTARVRSVEYVSGSKGQPDARYYLYLYEITMNSGQNFKDVRSVYDSATPKRFADIADVTPYGAVLQETGFNSMLFKLPYQAIKTIRSDAGNVETAFSKNDENLFSSIHNSDNNGIATKIGWEQLLLQKKWELKL